MNFNKAEFEFAAGNASQLPKSVMPEVIFSGRSISHMKLMKQNMWGMQ